MQPVIVLEALGVLNKLINAIVLQKGKEFDTFAIILH
jgi:hypothetical protein